MADISKTRIKEHLKRKTNPKIAEAIKLAKQKTAWLQIAKLIAGPARKYSNFNLDQIDAKSKDGETILIAGKVLGTGNLTKKVKICALAFSHSALERLKRSKHEACFIKDEIKSNPSAKGIKLIS